MRMRRFTETKPNKTSLNVNFKVNVCLMSTETGSSCSQFREKETKQEKKM